VHIKSVRRRHIYIGYSSVLNCVLTGYNSSIAHSAATSTNHQFICTSVLTRFLVHPPGTGPHCRQPSGSRSATWRCEQQASSGSRPAFDECHRTWVDEGRCGVRGTRYNRNQLQTTVIAIITIKIVLFAHLCGSYYSHNGQPLSLNSITNQYTFHSVSVLLWRRPS
jgi:hypothetical protein